MKKALALMLACLMAVSLCGCGLNENRKDPFVRAYEKAKDTVDQAIESIEDTEAYVVEEDIEVWGEESNDEGWNNDDEAEYYYFGGDWDSYEGDGYRLTIDSLRLEPFEGNVLNVTLENTGDHEREISTYGSCINGYVCDAFLYETLEPHEILTTDIYIYCTNPYGIDRTYIDELRLELLSYDTETFDYTISEPILIYPTGCNPEDIVCGERMTTDREQVAVDNDNFTFILLDCSKDSFDDYALQIYAENKTDSDIILSCENTAVNGRAVTDVYLESIPAGMRSYKTVWISADDLAGITNPDKLTWHLYAFDSEDWYDDAWYSEDLTFTMN